MRVLFVSQSSPLKEGGAETRTREVAVRLVRAGHQVSVLCGRTSTGDPPEQRVEGVEILSRKVLPDFLLRRFPFPHYFSLAAANLFLMFHVLVLLKRQRFDLIREDIAPFPPTFLLALFRLRTPRIAVMHMQPERLKDWVRYYGILYGLAGAVMGGLLRSGALKYDGIVCAAGWFAANLKRHPAISQRTRCVPNGVDLTRFAPRPDAGVARAGADIRLLSVGRLAHTKGHRYLIEALAMLKDEYPGLSLDIIGNGDLRESLLALAGRLDVARRVRILAPVAHDEMPDLYRRYDFFVMPSLWEGQPISLIEAMASMLPVVATQIDGIAEVLDSDCATFAQSSDSRNLADQLQWAFDNHSLAWRKAERAYERARNYDWALTASRELESAIPAPPAGREVYGRQ